MTLFDYIISSSNIWGALKLRVPMPTQFEFSPKSNLWVPNNLDTYVAFFILNLIELILKSQYEEGARDANNI